MSKITYVLDTSVLVSDPNSIKSFSGDVVIHITVLDELDKLKKLPNEAGRNARVCVRLIDQIGDLGNLSNGVLLENDSLFKVDITKYDTSKHGDALYGDNRILACAEALSAEGLNVVVVSNDINLRVRAKCSNLEAEAYVKDSKPLSDIYTGVETVINVEAGDELISDGEILDSQYGFNLHPNQFLIINDDDGQQIACGRKLNNGKIKCLTKQFPWDLKARNLEQACAIDLLMDPEVQLVSLLGSAGSGKSLIGLACALELVFTQKKYDKLIIYRPIEPVGKDIGYLPGSKDEKIFEYFLNIQDSFEMLLGNTNKKTQNQTRWKQELERHMKDGRILFEPLTYIRGRSIKNSLILLDEGQQIAPAEIKTLLTRAGDNSKIILNGDIEQIDNRDLDAMNNGLVYVIEKFKGSKLSGHLILNKCERSPLAEEAVKLL